MTLKILTNQLDEQIHARRSILANTAPRPTEHETAWVSMPAPDWSSLELHRRFWAEGDALELRLDVAGEPASRCLVARDGQFLFGPTGPAWARELLQEAALEWPCAAMRPAT